MIEQGQHPRTIMGRMGHPSITVTMNVDGRLVPAADDAVGRSMESQFLELGGADVVQRPGIGTREIES